MCSMMQKIVERIEYLVRLGETVASTGRSVEGVIGARFVDTKQFYEWKAASLSFLQSVFGEENSHYRLFEKNCVHSHSNDTLQGLGVLKAAKADIDGGYLVKISELAAADIFVDFLDMADHLLAQGYKDPASSLIGAVLEDGLRKMCISAGIELKSGGDISSHNQKLADKAVYSRLIQKRIQVWADIRNNADHGHFDAYKSTDVEEMLRGVQEFLASNLAS